MTLRPTRAQALGHGAYLGGLIGLAAGVAMLPLVVGGFADRLEVTGWLATLGPLLAGMATGGLAGVAFGRDEGVHIDDLGIHPIPRMDHTSVRWQQVDDVRAERWGGRTHVAVYLNSGRIARLHAPYDGRLLAGDPSFERKLFMLRNLWEIHRYALAPERATAPEAPRPRPAYE